MTSAQMTRLDQLETRIRSVWGRGVTLHLIAGLLAFLRWAIPLFLIGVIIDWMTYMPTPGRVVILITLLTVSCYRAWRGGWRHLRPFDSRRMALQLESHHGDLNSLLVSAIQFRDIANASGGSDELRDLTCRLAEEAAPGLRPEHAVPYSGLRRPGTVVMMLSGVIAVMAVMNGPFMGVGAMRIFCPWVTIAYPTNTQIRLEQGELVLKEGDSALIQASFSGVMPQEATISIRTGKGSARRIDLKVSNASCTYTIASASRDFMYRVKAGDDRTDWHKVRVIPAPRVKHVNVDVAFPAYLAREQESIEALTLTVPEGSKLNWQITLDRPISAATFRRDGEEPVALQLSEDGRQVSFAQGVTASSGYSFSWVEREHGFSFTSPRYYLQVASDQAPRVELTSPESNLVAMIGRPLSLAVRAQDDHGVGSTAVAYRVNQRDETAVELNLSPKSGQGAQPLDWDYRETLSDLKIGDTVSFTLQVSDRYPGQNGPHVVRSETRRITFLSKEGYLEQIQKKKDRLLSRAQTAYRQQRAAFEVVGNLEPAAAGYMETCQIEAIRQELIRDQLKGIAKQVQALLDDLAANKVSDAAEGESLEYVRSALLGIADTHLANAASRLRHQSGVAGGDTQESPDPSAAARTVNTAARELGSLVLLRSIDTAQEVYAREARMLAQVQASLRWRNVRAESADTVVSLSKEQDELAQWTGRLISDLQKGMRYEKRPLAVLRLIQSVKGLQSDETQKRMRQAAVLITQGQTDKAERLQAGLVTTLLDAEFSVRLSGAYSTLIKTRDQMRLLVKAQATLRQQCAGMSDQAFKARRAEITQAQEKLRKRLLTLLLPTVPAPRPQLFDETLPKSPPVQALLKGADRAMADVLRQFAAGKQGAAISQQRQAGQALTKLSGLVDHWSVELGLQTLGLSTLVAVTGERLAIIEEYEAQLIVLLEKTEIAAAEKQKVDGLAEPQLLLTEELAAFNSDLVKQYQSGADQDIPPLLSRMERAELAMRSAVAALEGNDAGQAIGHQEQAADILAQAYAIVTTQNEQLGLLQSLLMFQRAIGFANGYVGDIVAEQRDMIAATEALKSNDASHLLPMFANLKRCMDDVAPLLDMVAARVDAGSPLVFAISDLEDAMASLKSGDKLDAIDAQDVAAESLEKVNTRVKAVKSQAGYVAEIIAFLHVSAADINMLEYQQGELKRKAESTKPAKAEQLKALAQEQRALLTKAEKDGQLLASVTGMSKYTVPAKLMREALARLKSNDAPAVIEQMVLVEAALKENGESLFAVISMLHGLPSIEILTHTDSGVGRLVDVLAVASTHKVLFRATQAADAQAMKALAQQQGELGTRCQKLSKVGEPHAMLKTASAQLAAAATAMQSSDRDAIKRSQKAAMQTLRHFIIGQALILETAVPPAAAVDGDPDADGPGSDTESAFAAGFISDFVSGEAPKDQRTGWKVRGDRNRAALNQNFARELPLEYRGLLKNYYERVAK
jgi:hypothetical protein